MTVSLHGGGCRWASLALLGLISFSSAAARIAWAQPSVAAAEALFQEGLSLQREGNLALACPKLEQSFLLDPAGSTAFALGTCLEAQGRIASAWARYQAALQYAVRRNRPDKAIEVQAKIDALSPRLPRLRLTVAPDAASLDRLVIKVGGVEQNLAVWKTALPMDPGPVLVEASAPGHISWFKEFLLSLGETTSAEIPTLSIEPPIVSSSVVTTPTSNPTATSTSTAVPDPVPPVVSGPIGWSRKERVGLTLSGAGLLSLGAGSVLAIVATQKAGSAQNACFPTCDRGGGSTMYKEAVGLREGSIVAFSAGGALLASGLILYFAGGTRSPSNGAVQRPTLSASLVELRKEWIPVLAIEGALP